MQLSASVRAGGRRRGRKKLPEGPPASQGRLFPGQVSRLPSHERGCQLPRVCTSGPCGTAFLPPDLSPFTPASLQSPKVRELLSPSAQTCKSTCWVDAASAPAPSGVDLAVPLPQSSLLLPQERLSRKVIPPSAPSPPLKPECHPRRLPPLPHALSTRPSGTEATDPPS